VPSLAPRALAAALRVKNDSTKYVLCARACNSMPTTELEHGERHFRACRVHGAGIAAQARHRRGVVVLMTVNGITEKRGNTLSLTHIYTHIHTIKEGTCRAIAERR
jgi:hypothetical protein